MQAHAWIAISTHLCADVLGLDVQQAAVGDRVKPQFCTKRSLGLEHIAFAPGSFVMCTSDCTSHY